MDRFIEKVCLDISKPVHDGTMMPMHVIDESLHEAKPNVESGLVVGIWNNDHNRIAFIVRSLYRAGLRVYCRGQISEFPVSGFTLTANGILERRGNVATTFSFRSIGIVYAPVDKNG